MNVDDGSVRPTDLIIISGLSGSGKSVALQSLEDIGYYCIDNLPAVLLPEFNRYLPEHVYLPGQKISAAAVSIDSRNQQFLLELDTNLEALERHGRAYRILFLEAEESKIVRRYSETRRKHPLTDDATPLTEGIRKEREMLGPWHDRAQKVIDTTEMTPHELRGAVRDFAGGANVVGPLLLVESFGFKFGSPREADFVFDVRCLPNPHWENALRAQTGLDSAVQEFLGRHQAVGEMTEEIFAFLKRWLPNFVSENRSYITVAVGCTGGRHRSVYICEQLGELFDAHHINVQIRHRQLHLQSRQ